MSAEPHKLVQRQHRTHDKFKNDPYFNQILTDLSGEQRLQRGTIIKIADDSGMNRETLRTWRKKLKRDQEYKPFHKKPKEVGHVTTVNLPKEAMLELIRRLDEDYVSTQRYCPPNVVNQMGMSLAAEYGIAKFRASASWRKKLLKEAGLSIRKPHTKRRTEPNDNMVAKFLADVEAAKAEVGQEYMFNADETCWRVFNGTLKTITRKGADEVIVNSVADAKTGITVLAPINMAGDKLPLWMLAKGLTVDCEAKFRNDPRLRHEIASGKLVIAHTKNGWSDAPLAIQYMQWLHDQAQGHRCCLIWDVHPSHQNRAVAAEAVSLDMGLQYIPAGQTGHWQPLDRKIFGIIKKQAHSRLNAMMAYRDLESIDIIDAVKILCTVWEELPRDTVIKAWDIYEEQEGPREDSME